MAYPGSPNTDPIVQQRILTAFGEAVRLYREGHAEEARTILRSILEVDPAFHPAQRLDTALASGGQVDLAELLGALAATKPVDAEGVLARVRDALERRDFKGAIILTQDLLRELPGHAEGRALLTESHTRQRAVQQADTHIAKAKHAIDGGSLDEARNLLEIARSLDPHHPGLAVLVGAVEAAAGPVGAEEEFTFGTEEPTDGASPAPLPVPAALLAVSPAPPPAAAPPPPPPVAGAPPPPPVAAPPGPTPPAGDATAPLTFQTPSTGAPLSFDVGGDGEFVFGGAEAAEAPAAPRVQELLDQGQLAFDRGDYPSAIDAWSRIYLIDSQHAEAARRIEQARHRREEVERAAEHSFFEARDAFEKGNIAVARALCQEVLKLQPQHLAAHDLLASLDTPAAPPPPPPLPAEAEEDLFKDDFVPTRIATAASVSAAEAAAPARRRRPVGEGAATVARRMPLALLGLLAVAIVAAVALFFVFNRGIFPSGPSIDAGLAAAEKLAGQGRLQEAITLLQTLEAEGEDAARVNQQLQDYQRRLKTKAAPSQPSETGVARAALAAGDRVKALRVVRQALGKVPGDREMLAIQAEVLGYSPLVASLADAVVARNQETVRLLAADLLRAHPDDAEAERLWSAATFNQGLLLLRKYQVTQAHSLFTELAGRGDDPQVGRLKQFAASYTSRPIDPRYEIFVRNIELRPLV